ncbi:MAG: hypothetical protein EOO06_00435 [Chitinophagaceae bacterium]|nr:MAG: hypothetical protein EOO06_00435 [Chitinophagaceae bacterium]
MNRSELISIQDNFRPHLKNRDYCFIAPVDSKQFELFTRTAIDIAPGSLFNNSIHRVLSNTDATKKALERMPNGMELTIYVITRPNNDDPVLAHSTIEEYCQRNSIDFNS